MVKVRVKSHLRRKPGSYDKIRVKEHQREVFKGVPTMMSTIGLSERGRIKQLIVYHERDQRYHTNKRNEFNELAEKLEGYEDTMEMGGEKGRKHRTWVTEQDAKGFREEARKHEKLAKESERHIKDLKKRL